MENAVDATFDNRQSFWNFGEDILALAFNGDDLFEEAYADRMEEHGYAHVIVADGSGMFVLGDQIDHEEGGVIYLNVEEGELAHHGIFPETEV